MISETNRVWIELERKDKTVKQRQEVARLACQMLKRLGVEYGKHPAIFYSEKHNLYCRTTSDVGCFSPLKDDGAWYNLDYLSGEDVEFESAESQIKTPSEHVKSLGLKSLAQVSEMTEQSAQTLTNWFYNKRELFDIVVLGCVDKLDSKG